MKHVDIMYLSGREEDCGARLCFIGTSNRD